MRTQREFALCGDARRVGEFGSVRQTMARMSKTRVAAPASTLFCFAVSDYSETRHDFEV